MRRLGVAIIALIACEPTHPRPPTAESVLARLRPTVTCGVTLNATAIISGAPFTAPVHAQVMVTEPTDARFIALRSGGGEETTLTVSADKVAPPAKALTTFQAESIIGVLLGRPVIVPHVAKDATIVSADDAHAVLAIQGETMRQELEVVPFEETLVTKSVRVWEGDQLLYEARFADPKAPDGCNEQVPRSLAFVVPNELDVKIQYVQVRWMRE